MKGRVLVIENEADARRSLMFDLSREGYDVMACPDGISAIRELKSAQEQDRLYTHIITDIVMPDIDGMGMLKAIKVRYPGMPVIVITGFGDEAIKSAVLSECETAYLDEPFEFSDLLTELDRFAPKPVGAGKADADEDTLESAMYLMIHVTEPSQGTCIFRGLCGLYGSEDSNSVQGNFDIITVALGASQEEIGRLKEQIDYIQGVEIISASYVERKTEGIGCVCWQAVCLALRITEPARSGEIFGELCGMYGVERFNASWVTIVARGNSREEIENLKEQVGFFEGLEIVPASNVERPKLDRAVDEEFICFCSRAAYMAIRITEPARSKEIFEEIRGMDKVERCDAVRGDFDIVVAARALGNSHDEIGKLKERVGLIKGAEIVFVSDVVRPTLEREVYQFLNTYSRVKERDAKSLDRQPGRASYIFVDIDKEAIQRIFTAVFLSGETVFCDVIEDGSVLVAMVAEQGAVGALPRIIERLGRIDGVLRVREAAVIRLGE